MTIKGPRLVDSDTAQAFLTDLTNRPQYAIEAIDNALDHLAELPVGDWHPDRDAPVQDRVEQAAALVEVYVRGVLACALALGQVIGHHVFYTPPQAMAGYGEVNVGVLLRANDALTAARVAFGYLDDYPYFDGFHDGHAEVLLHLIDLTGKATTDRLRDIREGK